MIEAWVRHRNGITWNTATINRPMNTSGMDFTGEAKMAMFGYDLGVQAASLPKLIGWQPGDDSKQSGCGANRRLDRWHRGRNPRASLANSRARRVERYSGPVRLSD